MKSDPKRILRKAVAVTALFCMTTQTTFAALLNLSSDPLSVSQVSPKIMLTISKDQQLYKKAYNDYSDLNGDGVIDTTYNHAIEYYGYFDSYKCYDYVPADGRFEPKSNTADKYCGGRRWSGNFLNWVSMSRMDAVRKLLYGGLRSTDQTFDAATQPDPITVLERAYLPTDAHAWAKYYNGTDIDRLTPFSPPTAATSNPYNTTSDISIPAAAGDYAYTFNTSVTANVSIGDQITIQLRSNPSRFFTGAVMDITNAGQTVRVRVNALGISGAATSDQWTIVNHSAAGISFCNVTVGSTAAGNANSRSSTNTNPPLMRVAQGNFALWNANERWQCQWFDERNNIQGGFAGGLRSNGNQAVLSEIGASAENPSQGTHGLSWPNTVDGEYNVRVKVCDPGLFDPATNREKCKRYPNGNLKPIGLLQEYGDNGRFHFGLMTGSHAKNISGGVLRKNPGTLADEVRVDSDGAFREANVNGSGVPDGTYRDHPYRPRNAGDPRVATSPQSPPGIINTLNYMRVYGYLYTDGSYIGASGDNCTYQLTSLVENNCTSWGNPMSEVFFEAVRYFAGTSTDGSEFRYTAGNSKDNELGLPLAKTLPALTATNYCANLNVLVFNASVSDNDDDLRTRAGADINSAATIGALTNIVGNNQNENINGGTYFAGKVIGSTPAGDPGFELCTAKTITAFGDVSGICPEGPTTAGSYLIAGIAHHARTNRIRTDFTVPASDTKALKVTTYGIQLASNTPELEIEGGAGQRVVLQPIYRLNVGGNVGGGAIVDMRYVRTDTTSDPNIRSGKVYVNWEDSEQGGDYDQDMWGIIEWRLNIAAGQITITTNAVSASTANPQGFGYAISGTTRNGPHFHSGIYGFNYTDPTGALGCTNCNLAGSGGQTGPQSVTYALSSAAASGTLKDPLWYAAKYGGFTDSNNNNRPDLPSEFDARVNSTGVPGTDTVPDNYFLVTNPLGLVSALSAALNAIGKDTSGTSVMANSTSLSTTSRIYQARYDPADWSGQLIAKNVDGATGAIETTATWDAGLKLNAIPQNNRVIVTFDDAASRDGVAFRAGSISAPLLLQLNTSPITTLPDALGVSRLAWLRGDTSQETRNGGIFRSRPNTVLGDIVNSDPTYVGPPNSPNFDATYGVFRTTYYNRTPMLYVGANDGMLHGFDAVTGVEKLAYIPSKTFPHLAKLTSPTYSHRFYVDGPPDVNDAVVNGAWRTVLVGGLGSGGQGIYALDVTNPGGAGPGTDFTEANASNVVLWEFNDTDDAQLGYVFGKPVIRKMANNRWAAIVSAGYNNSEGDSATGNGRATLFIIFLDGPKGGGRTWIEGSDYVKIDTGVGTAATPNGLAPPMAVDADGDSRIDYVYSGDLLGNFWKFDLRAASVNTWTQATSRVVLFKATDAFGNAQPITSQAEGTLHPTGNGFVLTFGTGKYLEKTDPLSPFAIQSFYGIWDKNDGGANVSTQTTVANRTALLGQVISQQSNFRTIDPVVVPNWNSQFGWFMDFPASNTTGERAVFRPIIIAGRLIFTTLIPSDDPCAGGGTSFLMIVNPATGGAINTAVLDTNGDGILNASDQINGNYAVGVESTVGIAPTPVVVKGGPATGAVSATTSKIYGQGKPSMHGEGSMLGYTIMGGPLGVTGMVIGLLGNDGRVSWREIIK
jgi:type IV pilus assembly protein PilY1